MAQRAAYVILNAAYLDAFWCPLSRAGGVTGTMYYTESSKISNHADCQCRDSTSFPAQRRRPPGAGGAAGEAAANPAKLAA